MNQAKEFIQKHYVAIIVVILIIVVLLYLKRNWYKWFPTNTEKLIVNGQQVIISDSKQSEIKNLATDLYSDIYSTSIFTGHSSSPYVSANKLSDAELQFLASYYTTYISKGSSLLQDMNNETYAFTSGVDDLKARLTKLNLK